MLCRHSSRDSEEYIGPERFEIVDRVSKDLDPVAACFLSKASKACFVLRAVLSCLMIATIGKIRVTSSMVIIPGANLGLRQAGGY